jgi:outer membrane protein TolC
MYKINKVKMKQILTTITLLFACYFTGYGQLTIEQCQQKARNNYPQIQQFQLVEKAKEFDLKNANRGYLPQFSLSAKATWQSEVTELPFENLAIPNFEFEGLSKDQYQATIELTQTIWDGGAIASQKNTTKFSSEVEKQKIEVDLYSLKERVNQLFFGILLLDEQLKQNKLLQDEFQNNYDRIKAMKETGMSNQSDVDAVRVEQLKTLQREKELNRTLKSYKEMLSIFIGETISETMNLEKPAIVFNENLYNTNNRAELQLFEAQKNLYNSQKKSVNSLSMPKFSLFAQGGYGKPGLNMLKSDFTPYFIGGIRLNWNIGSFYTQANSKRKIDVQMQNVGVQKKTFLFNSNLATSQQVNEIEKMQEVIQSDDEIIQLRKSIKEAAQIKVEAGTLSTTDLIREINAENIAIQEKILHEMQLLINIENLKITTNN